MGSLDNDTEKQLLTELNEFDKFVEGAFATPAMLEERLSEIESRVAILTRGWRGTVRDGRKNAENSRARDVFTDHVTRFRAITFLIRQLKEALENKTRQQKTFELVEKMVDDKELKKKLQATRKNLPMEADPLPQEYWEAIRLNLGLHFRRVIKVGIENRLRLEAEEEANREMAKVKNPSWGLMKIAEGGGLLELMEQD